MLSYSCNPSCKLLQSRYSLCIEKSFFWHCCAFVLLLCSEISKAQDRLTDLLQNVYTSHPQYRELVRMIMTTVGRGGEGDVGQRIRDEILVIQVDIWSHIFTSHLPLPPPTCPCQKSFCSFIALSGLSLSLNNIASTVCQMQRNNNCKGGMMEEWHQKLHNNTSPDDVIICQVLEMIIYINFLDKVSFWKCLTKFVFAGTYWLYQEWLWH